MTRHLQIPAPAAIGVMAARAGFEISGVAPAGPASDFARFAEWVAGGFAGAMSYLTDHRAGKRETVRNLLPTAQSVICVGKLYNGPEPYSTGFTNAELGWISRYAWGDDYHVSILAGLEKLAADLAMVAGPFDWKACVDTAPMLERSLARDAGLGWIGKNTCLINQERGSWFFLGELITSLPIEPSSSPASDRCGTCTRCIEACPTAAIVPGADGSYRLDARRCISYLTIELRGHIDERWRSAMGRHVFGCDICQDVCPWNRRAEVRESAEACQDFLNPPLERLARMTEAEFRDLFRRSAVERTRFRGFLRNVAIAMGNSGSEAMRAPLERLARSEDPLIAEHAAWGLQKLRSALKPVESQ